jgi:hypothetical protein
MGLIFRCPTTGHKIETALEIADEKLLLSRKSTYKPRVGFVADHTSGDGSLRTQVNLSY